MQHSICSIFIAPPTKMEQTECSKMLAHKIQTVGNHSKKEYNIQNMVKVWNQEAVSC